MSAFSIPPGFGRGRLHLISMGTSSNQFPVAQPPEERNQAEFPGGVERVNLDKDRKHQLAQTPCQNLSARVAGWSPKFLCPTADSDTCQELGDLGSPCGKCPKLAPAGGECPSSVCHWLSPASFSACSRCYWLKAVCAVLFTLCCL